ncbi:hypothetical protein ALC62_06998 [Cyphomyrmex costatus]|uniref:Uncharacterized protein n=1 Tax=Cyphomyrmex costatus TaxID=456900 RepID=A0A195CQ26_9HYME|nr:hypothetical protein ALC62_06998 [Cyphomyrmex costatus]
MRPPDQCSGGGSGHDARRSRRGASRRWRAGKPTRRKAWMRKAQSTSGILARNPDTRCALPGNHRRDARSVFSCFDLIVTFRGCVAGCNIFLLFYYSNI